MELDELKDLIWQPSFPCDNAEFKVAFNRKFMLDMLNTKTTYQDQLQFNNTALKLLSHLKITKRPFQFYGETWFVN